MKKNLLKHLSTALLLLAAFTFSLAAPVQASAQNTGYEYLLPESDSRYYTADEISGMPLQVVCYAKNEIYARHGRMFQSAELQGYFDQQPWYSRTYGSSNFSDSLLNKYEGRNVELLSNREQTLKNGGYLLDQSGYSYDSVYGYLDDLYGQNFFYLLDDSDSRYLTAEDTTYMTVQELCYAKNEIYARHGRIFDSPELQKYFGSKTWYSGTIVPGKFDESVFNTYEATNVQYLTKLEYALTDNQGYLLDQPGYDVDLAAPGRFYDSSWVWDMDYIFADSDSRYLTAEELQNLPPQVLCYAKNEIYARRGRQFDSQELRDFFGTKYWYSGTTAEKDFSTDIFNQYEAYNAKLLKEYEFAREPGGYALY